MSRYEVVKLPTWTLETLPALMAERMAAVKTDKTIIPMLWQGILEQKIGTDRTAKLFIPKDCPQGTTFVVMNVPEGCDTLEFMEKSGWITLAEEKMFCLYVLEPAEGGWKTPEEEQEYIHAGFTAAHVGTYGLPGFSAMVVGYGSIGKCLHRIVMENPLNITSAVFVDASDLEPAYVAARQALPYDSDGYQGNKVPHYYGDLTYGNIPVPTWLVGGEMSAALGYWKTAAKAGAVSEDPVFGTVFLQNETHYITPEGNIIKVACKSEKLDPCSPSSTDAIYAFLSQYYRYGQGGRANMISTRIDYEKKGVQRLTFTDRNGFEREYLAYVPEAYRDGKKKLPVVIAFHGAQQSMRNMLENGQWARFADREGFMVVCPESTLVPMPAELIRGNAFAYRPLWLLNHKETPDWQFVDDLLDHMIANLPVDEKRIYSNGHSMGSMMTNYLASGPIAHRFAAFGSTSGGFRNAGDSDVGGTMSPIWVSFGEYDNGNHDIKLPGHMADTMQFWLVRNGLATEENADKVRMEGATREYVDGRYNHTVWSNSNGIPLVRYDWVEQKAHTHTAEENEMFWNEWFSKWSLDEQGNRLYEGKPIV